MQISNAATRCGVYHLIRQPGLAGWCLGLAGSQKRAATRTFIAYNERSFEQSQILLSIDVPEKTSSPLNKLDITIGANTGGAGESRDDSLAEDCKLGLASCGDHWNRSVSLFHRDGSRVGSRGGVSGRII